MTNAELVKYVYDALVKQGGPSLNKEDLSCAYRGANGRKCAAGWLINDGEYSPSFEGATCDNEAIWRALEASGVKSRQLRLVRSLQAAHDNAATAMPFNTKAYWRKALRTSMKELGIPLP